MFSILKIGVYLKVMPGLTRSKLSLSTELASNFYSSCRGQILEESVNNFDTLATKIAALRAWLLNTDKLLKINLVWAME